MFKILLLSIVVPVLAGASGLIVSRTAKGWEFTEAISLQVNGKDKVRILGTDLKADRQLSKLTSEKLTSMVVKNFAAGIPAFFETGTPPQYLVPQEIPKNAAADVAALWTGAKIGFKKSSSEKAWTEVPVEEFAAFLPEGVEDLAALCIDASGLDLLRGKNELVATQISLLSAAVQKFGTQQPMARVEAYVRDAMQSAEVNFDNGVKSVESLDRGLGFARLSQEAYASLGEHDRLRKALTFKRKWIERRVAILRALAAGEAWDEFLLAYNDFEKHQQSFADVKALQQKALRESMNGHWKSGKSRLAESEYRPAFKELQLASLRQPSNEVLQKDLTVAWAEYSRQLAVAKKGQQKQLSLGQRDAITQALDFASRYKDQGKLDDALKSIGMAEQIDAQSLKLLLKKAEILQARGELGQAITTLDQYDQLAVDDERNVGNKLRNEILFQLNTTLGDVHKQLSTNWSQKNVYQTRKLAGQAFHVSSTDPESLYYAGISALVTREDKQGLDSLRRYLEISNTLDADPARRAAVMRLLASVGGTNSKPSAEKSEPNWLSARALPSNIPYCPTSLAFQTKVEEVDASNHLRLKYVWEKNRLSSISSNFDKPQGTGEKSISFGYDDRVQQAISVRYEDDAAGAAPKDLDDLIHKSSVLFANNQLVDPVLFEKVGGENIAVGVSGNRFFHPFIWHRLYFFQLKYDVQGRVSQALEFQSKDPLASPRTLLEFDWEGLRLSGIRGYQVTNSDFKNKSLIYERRQQYQENRLVGEEIRSGGKTSKIKYLYAGTQLVAAECDKDESIDGRSRKVVFLGGKNVKGK